MSNLIIKTVGTSLNALSYLSSRAASNKAMTLFCTPRKGRILEQHNPFLETASQFQLQYKNLNIATYQWKGTGQTILLAHGWESNSQRWKDLILQLKKIDSEYNIIALDAPAHGATSGKQFTAILYSECINVVAKHFKPQIIIGHSVGGMATGFYQHTYQNKSIEKLVFLGAPSEFRGIFDNYINMMGYNTRIANGLDAIVKSRFNRLPSYYSLAQFSKTIETETLLIHDTKDKIIPYSDAKLIITHHKNAKLISTQGFGHGLKDNSVYRDIIEFIKS